MAFQPIIDIKLKRVHSYEALVRTINGGGAAEVFQHVSATNIYSFDQACRVKAIEWASKLGITSNLSINFMPNAVYEPARCIQTTLNAAKKYNFPISNITFEFSEHEEYKDADHVAKIVNDYKSRGFSTAIDDFGAGFSGLKLLGEIEADEVKIDRSLISDIHLHQRKQLIVESTKNMLDRVTRRIIVEGVEKPEEFKVLRELGFRYFQGYLFAMPSFESLPTIDFELL
ncbi:EAL domain-containing protein [Glaciecola sp. MH2013]|nr:EAL domain-containing protein [Glaciecola sp. MH2013]